MKKALKQASNLIYHDQEHIREHIHHEESAISFYRGSIHKHGNAIIAMARDHQERFIMVISDREDGVIAEFTGEQIGGGGVFARKCPLNERNARVIRQIFPWTAPVSLRKKKTTIGCGDRLGLATAGHIAAVSQYQASPVLAQQSIRELTLTKRNYQQVVDDATFLVYQTGFTDGYGADGDHLKTIADINVALAAGMPMITLDLSEVMNAAAGDWSDGEIEGAFSDMPASVRERITAVYADKDFALAEGILPIDAATAKRCAVMYTKALDFAAKVHEHLQRKRGDEFDLEISIDETTSPTLPTHHLFIASELIHRGVEFTSLAPRFIGEFQKAIDYIGDLAEFDRQFEIHCRIARTFGAYKISIHSGSDKFSVYPAIGRMTEMRCHVKTAGTSWLEAVRVIASAEPVLYRVMHKCALKNFEDVLKLYHITADISKIPDVDELYDEDLPKLMEMNEARQLLHITYGAILTDPAIRPMFFAAMHKHEELYRQTVKAHFEHHLEKLGVPK